MVNLSDRKRAAELLQGIVSGVITNRQFERDYPAESNDPGVREIYEQVYLYYDDFREHSLDDLYSCDSVARSLLDRCVLFLATDLEYVWPPRIRAASGRLALLRILRMTKSARRLEEQEIHRRNDIGDWDAWPFLSNDSYRESLSRQEQEVDRV